MFIRHDISKPHLYPLDVTTMRYGGYARDSHFHLRSLKSKHDLFGESGYLLGELGFRPPLTRKAIRTYANPIYLALRSLK